MGRSLKIAFVIDDLGYGGAQRQLSLLAPAFVARSVDAAVFCMSGITDPFGRVLSAGGVRVEAFARRSSLDLSRLFALRSAIKRDGAGLIHSFLDASNAYAFSAARSLGLPIVLSLRSDRISLTGARAKVLRAMLRRADLVVANSGAGRHTLVSQVGVDEDRALLVRNCVDGSTVGASGEIEGAPVVGFIGRLVPLKRVDRLIEAFRTVADDVGDAELVLVGDGPERERLGGIVAAAGLTECVTFAGTVDDVRPLLHRFTCLVLPSAHEGLPNAVLEALAAGVPVVARPVGDVPDLVDHGCTGLLVDDDSIPALADAITHVLRDGQLRRTARAVGPRFIRDHFSVDSAVDTLLPHYQRLAPAGP